MIDNINNTDSETNLVSCIVCKEEIKKGADYCHKCNHYQNRWVNRLRYGASVVGVLTLISSGLIFVITKAPEAISNIFPDKSLEVIEFTSNGYIAILNSGDGSIFVRDYQINTPFLTITKPIAISISQGKIAIIKGEAKDKEINTANKTYVNNFPPEKWNQLDCHYEPEFLISNSSFLKQLREAYGQGLGELPTTTTFNYLYIDSKQWLSTKVDVVGVLTMNPDSCN
jgi:hypothetical protein